MPGLSVEWPGLGVSVTWTGAGQARAETAVDLSGRILIDGFSGEFTDGEKVFGFNEVLDVPEESDRDSQWGVFNDINQVKITWDAQFLYVACDGFIFDNNMILLMDVTNRSPDSSEDDGLFAMTEINAWRRNFVFSRDFTPDLFFATWDRNTSPQIWTYTGPNQVTQINAAEFETYATFDQSAEGRSMEAAIPWRIVFGAETSLVYNEELDADVYLVPEGMDTLRFAAVLTAGPDGTGGPDSAPDNFGGHTVDSAAQVTIDNYAIIPFDLDEIEDVPDFGIVPKERITFKARPPIKGITFDLSTVSIEQKIVSPEEGRPMLFRLRLKPEPTQDDEFRTVTVSARIFDSLGKPIRTLYEEDTRSVLAPFDEAKDRWDGRDERGRMVPGGIYILSVVSEPGLSRFTEAFAVVR